MKKFFARIIILPILSIGLLFITASVTLAVAPTFTAKINNVDNTDVYIVLTFSAGVYATNVATGALEVADFTPAGTDVLTVSAVRHVAGSTHVILEMSGNVNSAAGGEVTITCAGAAVYNAGGEACVQAAKDINDDGDSTAPTVSTKILQDNDNDGKADRVTISYNEPVKRKGQTWGYDDAANWTVSVGGHTGLTESTVEVGRATGGTGADDFNQIKYSFTEGTVINTAVDSLTYTYTLPAGGSRVSDIFGNEIAAGYTAEVPTDGASPVIKTVTIEDAVGGNGMVDKITFTWSENVDTDDGVPPISTDLPTTVLPDGQSAVFGAATISDPAGAAATVVVTGITGQATANTAAGATAISGDLSAKWKDGTNNTPHATAATGLESVTDSAKPALLTVTRSTSSGKNTLAFAYSEALTVTGVAAGASAASTSSLGDMITAGTVVGIGSFATTGSITVPTTKNTVALNAVTAEIITVTFGAQASGYLQTSTTESQVAGDFTAVGAAVIVDVSSNQANTASAPAETYTTNWDFTRPAIIDAKLYDNYLEGSLVAGGTFASGRDGKPDTLVLTSSETLATVADGTTTRDDWSLASTSGEYGSSLTVVSAGGTGTTYTIVFSGANIYYSLGTMNVTYATTGHSFQNSAGLTIAPTLGTAYICAYGYGCTAGTVNFALITSQMVAPAAGDTTPPAVPTSIVVAMEADGTVKLSWVDPVASDLKQIKVYRAKNGNAQMLLGTVLKGIRYYIDSDVAVGDVLEYKLKSADTTNNASTLSSGAPITVTAVEVVAEEAPAEEELTPEEEEGAEEEVTSEEEPGAEPEAGAEEETEEEVPFIPAPSAPVYDVPATHWAGDSIEKVREAGLMVAKKEGKFMLGDNMTRAEAAKVIAAALGSGVLTASDVAGNLPFKDVAKTQWYAPYVSYIWKLGIVTTKDAFEPGRLVNRAELYVMILKAKGVKVEAAVVTTYFADIPSGKWFDAVATVSYKEGICKGKPKDGKYYFAGADNVTRGEAAVMFAEAFLE